ncbi:MAG: AAA family ATPase, partial [Leptospiraceae bacterium]|nr:AAA family ATPase [Leptospiraceae bacterium]
MDESLFQNNISPLAARLRPTQFSEVIGQTGAIHLLQNLYKPTSLLLYGPPGSGKTTLALLLSKKWNIPHVHLSAISSGVKEIKELIQKAKKTGSIALFLDEIHRFSSSQQDSLLDAVEKGEIILIGASTENPAFRINRPLLSRMRIYKLEALNKEALNQIFDRGLKDLSLSVKFESEVRDYLISLAGGDARKLLGLLEAVAESCSEEDKNISLFSIKEKLSSKVLIYDRSGENHYDFISAFIKSIRGSDPDAALYYLACMLEGGEDPVFIFFLIVILASEDIGNASLYTLPLPTSALNAVERIG